MCLTLSDPMDRSTPGLPIHHQLPEFTQTHVHCIGDAIQPSHPLSTPCSLAFNLSSIRSFQMSQFFTSGGQSIGFQLQHQSFQKMFRADFLQDGLVGSPWSPRDSARVQESSPPHSSKASILRRSAFFIVQLSHPYMATGKTIALTRQTFVGKVMFLLFNMIGC